MTSSPEAVVTDSSNLKEPPPDYGTVRVPDDRIRITTPPGVPSMGEIFTRLDATHGTWYKSIRPPGIPHGVGTFFSRD